MSDSSEPSGKVTQLCACCGQELTPQQRALCAPCRIAEYKAEQRAILTPLGIAPDALVLARRLDAAEIQLRFKGYHALIRTVALADVPPRLRRNLGGFACLRDGEALIWFKLWRPGSPVYAEQVWLPGRGAHTTLHNCLQARRGDIDELLDVLRAPRRRGRPRGTGTFRDRDEFLVALRIAMQGLAGRGREPTQKSVAQYFAREPGLPHCDVRQLQRWLQQFDVEWKSAVHELSAASDELPP